MQMVLSNWAEEEFRSILRLENKKNPQSPDCQARCRLVQASCLISCYASIVLNYVKWLEDVANTLKEMPISTPMLDKTLKNLRQMG
jgi:hypothetical protein